MKSPVFAASAVSALSRRALLSGLLAMPWLLSVPPAHAAKVGEAAPAFTATDSGGQAVSLAQYKGKFVVLEWHNHDCPYVKKHYGSGNLPKLQKEWTKKGVVWLAIVSSAPGKQGHVDGAAANANMKTAGAAPTATLLDPKGELGRLYGAKTTPHMFVISPQGTLIYAGAIDDKPTPDPGDIAAAKNYVAQALTEAMAGKPVTMPSTPPYGCSVKY
ncbi:MAG TPA: thioredoxin family protein [Pseudomonadota bacterium]|nr:thioredoxin family protein [Pseudomonadota bacterium]